MSSSDDLADQFFAKTPQPAGPAVSHIDAHRLALNRHTLALAHEGFGTINPQNATVVGRGTFGNVLTMLLIQDPSKLQPIFRLVLRATVHTPLHGRIAVSKL